MTVNEQRELIAQLCTHPGYKLLIEQLEEIFESLLAGLAEAKDNETIIKYGRLFQVLCKVRNLLANAPQDIKAELDKELEALEVYSASGDAIAIPFAPHRRTLLQEIERTQ